MAKERNSSFPDDKHKSGKKQGDSGVIRSKQQKRRMSSRKRMLAMGVSESALHIPTQPTKSEIKTTLTRAPRITLPEPHPLEEPATAPTPTLKPEEPHFDSGTTTTYSQQTISPHPEISPAKAAPKEVIKNDEPKPLEEPQTSDAPEVTEKPKEAEEPTHEAEPDGFPIDLSEDFTVPVVVAQVHEPTTIPVAAKEMQPQGSIQPPKRTNSKPPKRKRRWRKVAAVVGVVAVGVAGAVIAFSLIESPHPSTALEAGAAQSTTAEKVTAEPVPRVDPEITSTLENLSDEIAAARTVAEETSGRLYDQSTLDQLNEELASLGPWVSGVASVNESGLGLATASQIKETAGAQINIIQALTNRLESEAANWDLGQKIEADLGSIFDGGKGAVAVWDANTKEPIVQIGADETWVPASTFKLFTAYSILNALDQGEITEDNVVSGWTLDRCFQDMIIQSHNDCATEWLYYAGYDRVQDEAHQIGATETYFAPGDIRSTANDLQHFFQLLHDDAILSDSSRDYLADKLMTHDFRHSIPAMMYPEDVTINKVGFLDALHNDVGLVYTPNGDYTIAILTDYLSWNTVRQAASIIRADLEPTE